MALTQRALSARSRGDERGAAIFVVVMVLTMLTAIGVFAVRASSMAGAASGYERQNTQNHYVSEFGLLGAVTELSTTRRSAYVTKMAQGEDCMATRGMVLPTGGATKAPCYTLYAKNVQDSVSQNFNGRPLFESSSADAGTVTTPGSLGPAALQGDFKVEMSDPGPVGMPVAGTDVGGTGVRFKYLQVTLTAIGQVRPASDPTCDPNSSANTAGIAGNETGRAFVVIGPLP
jgi:hypothetical protein